ncbi:hypothetical protein EL17_08355 [Anditalea andensis]|uniref:DUF2141 domain-containing protein n=2 Tax=Anditalea andensis TaxID=1048983 RepID=A0A074LK27_9BACT|nr:hypothetical protein EL17_08355 [Anditalea andensis]
MLIWPLCLLLFVSAHPVDQGIFIIQIQGLRNADGVATVALYEKDNHLSEDDVKATFKSTIKNNSAVIMTKPLDYGNYSVVVLHDENNNGKMDYNIVRMPKEGVGFSNNPKIGLSKPSFEATKVTLGEKEKKITIKMIYF